MKTTSILSLVAALALVGCGSSNPDASSTTAPKAANVASTPTATAPVGDGTNSASHMSPEALAAKNAAGGK